MKISNEENDITLTEGCHRGFLSNYITILTSFYYLTNKNFKKENIFISDKMFYFYGDPHNWFSSNNITSEIKGTEFNSTQSHTGIFSSSLKDRRLNNPFKILSSYVKYFPFCERVKNLLNNFKIPNNCLGIHYRGTDHENVLSPKVSVDTFIKNIDNKLKNKKYNNVFIAGDEINPVNEIKNFCIEQHNVYPIINNFFRSSTKIPIFKQTKSSEQKIQIADEVIIDSFCLSHCSSILCRDSNIINFATILNPSLFPDYLDLEDI